MKKTFSLFAILFAVVLFVACATTESETLKKARTEQDGLMKEIHELDAAISEYSNKLNGDISAAGMDSTLLTDSMKMKAYTALKDKFNSITEMQSKWQDWKNELKMLPSLEEIANGAENPFGKDAKDEDVLVSIEKAKADFATKKAEMEAMMK